MQSVLYPGSFDPVTVGHLDIITRAAQLFPRVVVGILHNPQKPSGAFDAETRIALLQQVTAGLDGVEIRLLSGLLVDAWQATGADAVLRGVRGAQDMESELQMARLNRQLAGMETIFFAASPGLSHISANMVREIGRLGGDLSGLVPDAIRQAVANGLSQS